LSAAADPLALLKRIATAPEVTDAVTLVAAHQDDETLGLGGRFSHLNRLTLIHLTDGAPEAMNDALKAGFDSREAYARARSLELQAALAAAGARPLRTLTYGVTDQKVVDRLPDVIDRLESDLRGQAAVITHVYEGGHPDHDAAAFAVQAACARLGPKAPVRLEFAGYHLGPTGPATGVFFEGGGVECAADERDRERKRGALAAFRSQADVLAMFKEAPERLRLAPTYDFSRPPAPGRALYDRYGWTLTSAMWRERVAAVFAPC
jgi:LmbE family N-acetylglucosaminyl deacetylase